MITNGDVPAKQILVFSPRKRLVAIFYSTMSAAKAFGIKTSSISYTANGFTISCHGLYFRHLEESTNVGLKDIGTLRIEDYDRMLGIKRTYYKTSYMGRKGMKYKKKKQPQRK